MQEIVKNVTLKASLNRTFIVIFPFTNIYALFKFKLHVLVCMWGLGEYIHTHTHICYDVSVEIRKQFTGIRFCFHHVNAGVQTLVFRLSILTGARHIHCGASAEVGGCVQFLLLPDPLKLLVSSELTLSPAHMTTLCTTSSKVKMSRVSSDCFPNYVS